MTENLSTRADSEAVAAALNGLRTFERHAAAGWPDGYDAARVASDTAAHLAVLDGALAAMPPEMQRMVARSWVESIGTAVVRRASVPLRDQKGAGRSQAKEARR